MAEEWDPVVIEHLFFPEMLHQDPDGNSTEVIQVYQDSVHHRYIGWSSIQYEET